MGGCVSWLCRSNGVGRRPTSTHCWGVGACSAAAWRVLFRVFVFGVGMSSCVFVTLCMPACLSVHIRILDSVCVHVPACVCISRECCARVCVLCTQGSGSYSPSASVSFVRSFTELNSEMLAANARIDTPHHWQSSPLQWMTNARGLL